MLEGVQRNSRMPDHARNCNIVSYSLSLPRKQACLETGSQIHLKFSARQLELHPIVTSRRCPRANPADTVFGERLLGRQCGSTCAQQPCGCLLSRLPPPDDTTVCPSERAREMEWYGVHVSARGTDRRDPRPCPCSSLALTQTS